MAKQDSPGPGNVYLQTVVLEDEATHLQEVHICVGGPDVSRLKDAVLAGFRATIERHLGDAEFGGGIHVVVLSEVTPQSPALWAAIADMEVRLKALIVAGRLKTASGRALSISVEYTDRDARLV
jgi:hypothetical protein